jgi:hypothetical protein
MKAKTQVSKYTGKGDMLGKIDRAGEGMAGITACLLKAR